MYRPNKYGLRYEPAAAAEAAADTDASGTVLPNVCSAVHLSSAGWYSKRAEHHVGLIPIAHGAQ